MKLTRKERLILWNQYSILGALRPEESEYYERCKTIVAEGYRTHYKSLYDHIDEREFPADDAREVMAILSMFEAIKDSAPAAKEIEAPGSWLTRFPGFDDNSECDYLGYLDFLVKKGTYAHLVDPARLNSRAHLLPRYREMLAKWVEMNRPKKLSAEGLKELFSWHKQVE